MFLNGAMQPILPLGHQCAYLAAVMALLMPLYWSSTTKLHRRLEAPSSLRLQRLPQQKEERLRKRVYWTDAFESRFT